MRMMGRLLAIAAVAFATAAYAGEVGKEPTEPFTLKDGDFSLSTEVWLHFRTDYLEQKVDFSGPLFDGNVDTKIDPKLDFRLRNARIRFTGKAFFPWLTWKIETDFGKGAARTRDIYIRTNFNSFNSWTFGQFKAPFDIFKLYSDKYNSLAERPVNTDLLWFDTRDIGVMYEGQTKDSRFTWAIAEQNGSGSAANGNDDDGFLTTLRFAFQSEGGFDDKASAIDHPDKLQWTVGVAYLKDSFGGLVDANGGSCDIGLDRLCVFESIGHRAYELFGAIRGTRWQATVSAQRWNVDDFKLDSHGRSTDGTLNSAVGDFGIFVTEKDELVARYGKLEDKDRDYFAPGSYRTRQWEEWRLGYTHFWNGEKLKLTVDIGTSDAKQDTVLAVSDGPARAARSFLRSARLLGGLPSSGRAAGSEKVREEGIRLLLGFVL